MCQTCKSHRSIPPVAAAMLGTIVLCVFLAGVFAVTFLLPTKTARGAEPPTPSAVPKKNCDCKTLKCRAAAALALAEAEANAVARAAAAATPAVAPMPRAVVAKLPYGDGYKRATLDQMPLVIYVSTDGPQVPGAIVSRAESFGEVTGPAVIVGFPMGNRVYVDATLAGDDATPDAVRKAVSEAAKKIEVPVKEMPPGKVALPSPLDYQIAAEVACCVCGQACQCAYGKCPAGCPVQAAAVVTWELLADGRQVKLSYTPAGKSECWRSFAWMPAREQVDRFARDFGCPVPYTLEQKVTPQATAPKGYKRVCENGRCRLVPID